jgi:hypothetical protein
MAETMIKAFPTMKIWIIQNGWIKIYIIKEANLLHEKLKLFLVR